MIRKTLLICSAFLALSIFAASCNKYSYYYRDQKDKDCTKPATKSHKYKK